MEYFLFISSRPINFICEILQLLKYLGKSVDANSLHISGAYSPLLTSQNSRF